MTHAPAVRRRRATALASATVATALLVGCSGEELTDAATDTGPRYADSPLATYMGNLWDLDRDAMEDYGREHRAIVAQCMADEGFDYEVDQPDDGAPEVERFEPDEQNTETWVATHGYGIFTQDPATMVPYQDPNADYVASLSTASRAAYEETLSGTWNGTGEYSDVDHGCMGQADAALEGSVPFGDPDMDALWDEVLAMQEDLAASPGMVAADAAWADCMADAGFGGFDSPTAASQSFFDESVDGYLFTPPDEDVLAELREREIDTALADFRCKQDTGYDEVVLTALHAAEEQFIVDHRAQLDALIAEFGG